MLRVKVNKLGKRLSYNKLDPLYFKLMNFLFSVPGESNYFELIPNLGVSTIIFLSLNFFKIHSRYFYIHETIHALERVCFFF